MIGRVVRRGAEHRGRLTLSTQKWGVAGKTAWRVCLHFSGSLVPQGGGFAKGNAAVSAAVLRASRPQKAATRATRLTLEHTNRGARCPPDSRQDAGGTTSYVCTSRARLPWRPGSRVRHLSVAGPVLDLVLTRHLDMVFWPYIFRRDEPNKLPRTLTRIGGAAHGSEERF